MRVSDIWRLLGSVCEEVPDVISLACAPGCPLPHPLPLPSDAPPTSTPSSLASHLSEFSRHCCQQVYLEATGKAQLNPMPAVLAHLKDEVRTPLNPSKAGR